MRSEPAEAAAFTAAFARHGRALWLLAAAWVGRGDAADLVQEAARIAWQRRATFATGSDHGAWLAQIVRHTGANWRRQRRPVAQDPATLPEPLARPDRRDDRALGLDAEQLPDELAQALQALPEVARACLLLHVVGGLTFPAIATLLDIPENTAMSHARRARLVLRAACRDEPAPTAVPQTP